MEQWLLKKWKTKSEYIILLLILGVAGAYKFFMSGMSYTPAEIGIALGGIVATVLLFGPIVVIDVRNIKVRNPKDKFVEPSQLKIGVFWFAGMLVGAFFALIILTLIQLSNLEILTNTEGVVGSMIMMFLIVSVIFSPITAYMFNAKLRYKRIVEYKSSEWIRLQK